MQVINSVIHIFIIWLGYIYRTLAKWYLLWSLVEVLGRPLCVTPGLLFEFTLLIVPRAKNFLCKFLIAISLGTLAPGNWAAKSARSPGMKSLLVPLLLWNSMARNDRWGWLNCGLGGILVLESLSLANEYSNHYLGQKKTTSSLKNINKFVTCTHTFTWCQRRPWYFTCICKSLIWISHYQQ